MPLLSYPTGEVVLGPVNVPSSIKAVRILLARNTVAAPTVWPSQATRLRAFFELEYNGVWEPSGAFEQVGGPVVDRQGAPLAQTEAGVFWRAASQQPTRGRVTLTVIAGPLRTSGAVIFED